MINLGVEEKCQDCPNFSPMVEQIDASTIGGEQNLLQTVYCEHKGSCKSIEKDLVENAK